MSNQNKTSQFMVTTIIFFAIFFIIYFLFLRKDEETFFTPDDYDVVFINDGTIYFSDFKGEFTEKAAKGVFVAWDTVGEGVYFIDNYAKLRYYDIDEGKPRDVTTNITDFEISPTGDAIAVVQTLDEDRVLVIDPEGTVIADLGPGTAPRWSGDGTILAYLTGGGVTIAARPSDDPAGFRVRFSQKGSVSDMDISPDGKTILMVETVEMESSLSKIELTGSGFGEKTVIKTGTLDEVPPAGAPVGFSEPRFFSGENTALFIYNDASGGRVFKIDIDDDEVKGLTQEPGPIFRLSIAPDDETVAYFLINTAAQPSFTHITDEGDVPMILGPDTINEAFVEKIYRMNDEEEIGGDEVNKYNLDQFLESDVIRVIDLKRDVYWVLGSGQNPSLRK
ncbi:MAG: PD40 domain-containing protein [Deltaproteobacteria bacterium]|nr:PD40 domain-containing protein [Candidatus Zymogenaceae bacterium]